MTDIEANTSVLTTPPSAVEARILHVDKLMMQLEIDGLKKDVDTLEAQLNYVRNHFSFTAIRGKDSLVLHYTGLPTTQDFDNLLGLYQRFEITYHSGWRMEAVTAEEQLFLTPMKLRCNFSHADLAVRFSVSESTISNITLTWINVLHEVLYEGMLQEPDMPSVLKNKT